MPRAHVSVFGSGGEFVVVPASGGELANDPFTRSDAATLSSPWIDKNGQLGIFSNQVDVTVTGDENIAYYNGVSWPNDGYAEIKVIAAPAANRAVAVGYRLQTGSNRLGYYAGYDQAQSGDGLQRIWKFVGTAWTQLGSPGASNVAVNDIIRIQVIGSTIKMFVNTVEVLSVNDTDHATGKAGIYGVNSAVDVALLDNFAGGF